MPGPDPSFRISTPSAFDFGECLHFLNRNPRECLHTVSGNRLIKLMAAGGKQYLTEITVDKESLLLVFPGGKPPESHASEIKDYVHELFDLGADLEGFYAQVGQDRLLGELILQYRGLRLIGMPDLFEALCWAIIGQQINLNFAYTLKKNLVHAFGSSIEHEGTRYYAFPEPSVLREVPAEALLAMQFSGRKAEYILEIARQFEQEGLSKEMLLGTGDRKAIVERLVSIRGVGMWTAEYVLMKCLKYYDAFPVADIGLQNAIRQRLGRADKPSLDDIHQLAEGWKGWESYATFYLWRSLVEDKNGRHDSGASR